MEVQGQVIFTEQNKSYNIYNYNITAEIEVTRVPYLYIADKIKNNCKLNATLVIDDDIETIYDDINNGLVKIDLTNDDYFKTLDFEFVSATKIEDTKRTTLVLRQIEKEKEEEYNLDLNFCRVCNLLICIGIFMSICLIWQNIFSVLK
jgi:hypothetical protein